MLQVVAPSTCLVVERSSEEESSSEHDKRQEQEADIRLSQASLNRSSSHVILSWEDLTRVSLLGRGTYADVYHMIQATSAPRNQYAVKYLNEKRWKDEPSDKYAMAATDLRMEATILSHLDHENIVKLRGVSSPDNNWTDTVSTSTSCTEEEEEARFSFRLDESVKYTHSGPSGFGGFFLCLDILNETLKDRLARWHVIAKDPLANTSYTRGGIHRQMPRTSSAAKSLSSSATKGTSLMERQKSFRRSQSDEVDRFRQQEKEAPTISKQGGIKRQSSFLRLLRGGGAQEKKEEAVKAFDAYMRRRGESSSKWQNSFQRGAVLRRQPSSSSSADSKKPPSRSPISSAKMYGRIETVALGVANAMNYLHQKHILFRDLKPANIGFDNDGKVKLFDFGLARHIDDCSKYEVAGTPRYLAPEILDGEGYSFGSDAFSFGLVFYEICTLEAPAPPAQETSKLANTTACETACESPRSHLLDGEDLSYYRIPLLDSIPCTVSKRLIQDCLQTRTAERPSFETILNTLRTIALEANEDAV